MRSGRRCIALAIVLGFTVAPLFHTAVAASSTAACESFVHRQTGSTDSVPVVFVHGITSSAAEWTSSPPKGGSQMLPAVAALPGVATYTFDYSSHSLDWVANGAVGPRLAQGIACLATQSHHKVIVVAHSMGGLATEFAQGEVDSSGVPIANDLALVITIGTPFQGSQLLGLLKNSINTLPPAVHAGLNVALTICGLLGEASPLNDGCWLVGVPNSPAGLALTPGSPQLAVTPLGQARRRDSLPAWAAQVPVHTIAADIELSYKIGRLSLGVSIGDLPVSVVSATADASPGNAPFVASCGLHLSSLASFSSLLVCYHGHEISNAAIVADAVNQVRFFAVLNQQPTRAQATPPSGSSFHLPGVIAALLPLVFLLFIFRLMFRRPRRTVRIRLPR